MPLSNDLVGAGLGGGIFGVLFGTSIDGLCLKIDV